MKIISKLKRGKYVVTALILALASVPVIPIARAENVSAAQFECVNSALELSWRFAYSNTHTASLCSDIENVISLPFVGDIKQTITANGNSTLELNGHSLISNLSAAWGGTLTIVGEGLVDGDLGGFGNIVIEGGTYTSNPSRYVNTNQFEVYPNQNAGTWTVAEKSNVTTHNVAVMVDGTAEIFTVTPAEYVGITDITVIDESGEEVTDAVEVTTEVKDGAIIGTAKGLKSGRYTVVASTSNNREAVSRVTVIETVSLEEYVKVGSEVELEIEAPQGYSNLTVEYGDENVADAEEFVVNGKSAGDAVIVYTFVDEENNPILIVNALIHVYDIQIEDGKTFSMMEGTSINVNDEFVGTFENPEAIEVKCYYQGDPDSDCSNTKSTLTGNTVADGVFTAGHDATLYELHFFVNGEDVTDTLGVSYVSIYTFAKQTIDDKLLSVSGTGAERQVTVDLNNPEGSEVEEDEPCTLVLDGCNIPLEYTFESSDESIVSVSGDAQSGYTLTANKAGDATITVVYGFDAYGAPKQKFDVKVSDFWNNANRTYTVADGDVVSFIVSEEYDQDMVTCTIDGVACEESDEFVVTKNEDGEYTIEVTNDARGGRREFVFTDNMLESENTVSVILNVHEIVIEGETEQYMPVDTLKQLTIKERTNQGYIWADVVDAQGGTGWDMNALCVRNNYLLGDDYTCSLRADEAGLYTIRVVNSSLPFGAGRVYDTEYITVYAFDFTVEDTEYHVKKDDSTQNLITAINKYWNDTKNDEFKDADGEVTTEFVISKVTGGATSGKGEDYYFWPTTAEAGAYNIDLSALVNGEVVDTKTVTIYVYDMVKPEQTKYYGEMKDGKNEFDVKVADKINDKIAGMAKIDYTVVEGDATGIVVDVERGEVTVNKPGKYTVKYTDTMNRGKGGLVGEYTATFEVFNLEADAPKGQFIDLGDPYEYAIDPTNTYGNIEVVITRTDENGDTTEISRKTTTYPNDGERTFEFTPEEEGKYTVRIENLSAKEHGFREVEKGEFYVIAREYDFKLVRTGTVLEITSDSIWSVDSARDSYNPESLTVEDGKVVLDTSDMQLGVRTVTLYHKFGKGQKEALKRVAIAIYDTAPESTPENNVVIDDTLDDLFGKVEKLTNDPETLNELEQKVWEAIMEAMVSGEEVDFETITNITNGILGENVAFGKAQEMFGSEWQTVIGNLNEAVAYGDVIRTRVNVEEITPETDVEAAILKVLNPYGVDSIDYYDVTVEMYVTYEGEGGEEEYSLGLVHKLNGAITVALAKTTDPETGYTRTYYVVRMHDGEEPEVLVEGRDFYIEDGVIYVISDKFSTYAVAYKDTLIPETTVTTSVTSPDTGASTSEGASASSNALVMLMAVMTAITLAGAAKIATYRRK